MKKTQPPVAVSESDRFFCETVNAYILDDDHPVADPRTVINELFYKDLAANTTINAAGARTGKLPYRDWAALITSVRYIGVGGNNIVHFFVPNKYNGWEVLVKFDEWEKMVADTEVNAVEAARLLLWGSNLRLHCPCPSYLYWGHAYVLTQYDSAIYPENRFPKKNNPQLLGNGCKHCRRVLKVLPFQLGKIASAIKQQRTKVPPRKAPD